RAAVGEDVVLDGAAVGAGRVAQEDLGPVGIKQPHGAVQSSGAVDLGRQAASGGGGELEDVAVEVAEAAVADEGGARRGADPAVGADLLQVLGRGDRVVGLE